MTNQILIVFGVLVGAIALFAWGRIRVDIVAILVMLALMLSHVLTPDEALACAALLEKQAAMLERKDVEARLAALERDAA